jgi:hypothetical protein
MKAGCIPLGLALAAVLALSSSGALAAAGGLHALSETEMSDAYGRGLTAPTLTALGALTTQEQGSSAVSASSAGDGLAALGALSAEALQSLDRQLVQQRAQTAASSLQNTLKIAQTLLALDNALAPINNNVTLPLLPFPLLFTLPSLPSLAAIEKKH